MLSIWCQTYIHLHSGPAFYVDSSCRGRILSYWHSKSIKYTRKFDLGWEGQKAESSKQRCRCHLYHFSYSKAWRACGLFGETPGGKRYEAHTGSYVLMIYVTTFAGGEAENACEGSGTKGSIVSARKKKRNRHAMQIGKWHATSMCLKCLLPAPGSKICLGVPKPFVLLQQCCTSIRLYQHNAGIYHVLLVSDARSEQNTAICTGFWVLLIRYGYLQCFVLLCTQNIS